jgi:mannose-1-phosphate guanylyltransferase
MALMDLSSHDFGSGGHTTGTMALPDAALLDAVGSPRFWPLSTPATPKPVLPLVDGRPLIADTVGRLDPLIPAGRVLVVTSADIAGVVRAALPAVPSPNFLIEERPMGTAAALAWGVSEVRRRGGDETTVCAMHADLAAAFPAALRDSLKHAGVVAARERALIAVGVRPTRAETSFGYMTYAGPASFDAGGTADVTEFVEKPGPAAAEALIRQGALWHSGMMIGPAQEFLDALAMYTPEVAKGLAALHSGDVAAFVAQAEAVSIERGLLERMGRLLVIAPDIGWDDVGTWAGLRSERPISSRSSTHSPEAPESIRLRSASRAGGGRSSRAAQHGGSTSPSSAP